MMNNSLWCKITCYAKAHVALVGSLATWAIATFPPKSTGETVGSVVLAVLTALGVATVKNRVTAVPVEAVSTPAVTP